MLPVISKQLPVWTFLILPVSVTLHCWVGEPAVHAFRTTFWKVAPEMGWVSRQWVPLLWFGSKAS